MALSIYAYAYASGIEAQKYNKSENLLNYIDKHIDKKNIDKHMIIVNE